MKREQPVGALDAFGARLDLLAISSYPFICFPGAAKIPPDYYTKLASHTTLPLAVAEGGYISKDVGPFRGSPRDQTVYLKAVHRIQALLCVYFLALLVEALLERQLRRAMQRHAIEALPGWTW